MILSAKQVADLAESDRSPISWVGSTWAVGGYGTLSLFAPDDIHPQKYCVIGIIGGANLYQELSWLEEEMDTLWEAMEFIRTILNIFQAGAMPEYNRSLGSV